MCLRSQRGTHGRRRDRARETSELGAVLPLVAAKQTKLDALEREAVEKNVWVEHDEDEDEEGEEWGSD